MTRDEITARIVETMAETFDLPGSKITPEADLSEDLDLDSIDAIDMAVQLQDLAGQRVPEEALRSLRTVGDVVDLVEGLLNQSP
ncbi:MAG: acyl carrier protein [Myxococcota bacterium]|nr:acyl carrier protein [Myxococcota bacterium]